MKEKIVPERRRFLWGNVKAGALGQEREMPEEKRHHHLCWGSASSQGTGE
jgi:hypothetical protein